MKFILRYSSSPDNSMEEPKTIIIDTLEELIKFQEENDGKIIVMDNDNFGRNDDYIHPLRKEIKKTIEIYDDYRE